MIKLRIIDSNGIVKLEKNGKEINYNYKAPYSEGDVIEITSPEKEYIVVKPCESMIASIVCIPNGSFRFPIPFGDKREAYKEDSWSGDENLIYARPATDKEIYMYRNIALNSSDYRYAEGIYPHASANVVTNDLAAYEARNAIDGITKNDGHGRFPNHSYSGGKREDIEFVLDFGQKVHADYIVLYLRADFPHDTYWKELTFEFSDGTYARFYPQQTANPQRLKVDKITDRIIIKNFKQAADPLSFAALSQIEVYGNIVAKCK